MRKLPLIFLLFLLFLSCDRALHSNVHGPEKATQVQSSSPEVIHSNSGPSSSLALLVLDKESHWQDLASAIKDVGIPLTITDKFENAQLHKMIFMYPYVSGKVLSEANLDLLRSYVQKGGVVFATNVLGNGPREIFGYKLASEGRKATQLTFKQSPSFLKPELSEDEKVFKLKNRGTEIHLGSTEYDGVKVSLATFDTGKSGFLQNKLGQGHAFALGFDLGDLSYLAHTARGEELVDVFVNNFTPVLDTFLYQLKAIYQKFVSDAVTLGLFPEAHSTAVLVTYDIDFVQSLMHTMSYAEQEKKLRMRGTYFIQTKYVKDFSEDVFFSPRNLKRLDTLRRFTNELGSHSVSHSLQFHHFAMGSGEEFYPDYRPFVKDAKETEGGTILGELRVSKFLLDMLVPSQKTVSFRAGHLRNPHLLPQALVSTGFLYDSSMTANASLSHLPAQLSYDGRGLQMLPVYRFPVTLEDEKWPFVERVEAALDICRKISRRGGVCNLLMHPNQKGAKLEAHLKLIKGLKELGWTGTMQELGHFWRARHELSIRVEGKRIYLKANRRMNGLTLETDLVLSHSKPEGLIKLQDGKKIVLGEFEGEAEVW